MIATVVNVSLVLVGSVLGLLFRRFISQKMVSVLTHALGLCVAGIGISSLISTQDMLCVIVCMVLGTVIGQGLDIEARLERGGALPAPSGDCGDVGGGGRPHCGHRHQHVGAGQREDPGGEYAPRHVPAPGVFPYFSRDRQPGVLGCRFFALKMGTMHKNIGKNTVWNVQVIIRKFLANGPGKQYTGWQEATFRIFLRQIC